MSVPAVVDTEGTPITDEEIPLYSGSRVKLAFYQQALCTEGRGNLWQQP